MSDFKINADSTPDFDDWGWDSYWDINDWIFWHKELKKKYGKKYANDKFIFEWNKQTIGANPLDAKTFNSNFRNYAKANGFFDRLFDNVGIFEPVLKGTGAVVSTSDKAVKAVESAASGLETTGKITKYLIPAAAVLLFIGGGYYLYNKYLKK